MLRTALALAALLFATDVHAQLTTRQMRTTGTPTTIPAAAGNGTSDSVARVDHTHACATASASQAGCLSSANWSTFNGKESVLTFSAPLSRATNTVSMPAATSTSSGYLTASDWASFNYREYPLTFSSGLTRLVDSVTCDDAGTDAKGCVTTGPQSLAGAKTFKDPVYAAAIYGDAGLTLSSSGTAPLALSSASGVVEIGAGTSSLRRSPNDAGRFTINLSSKNLGVSTLAVTNESWSPEATGFTTDLDIEHGDLKLGGTVRIDRDGAATLGSLSATSWGSHGHTNAASGGTLSASAIASGTLPLARGGTGHSTVGSHEVLIGSGSSYWMTAALPQCTAPGSVLQYNRTTTSWSCGSVGVKLNSSTSTTSTSGVTVLSWPLAVGAVNGFSCSVVLSGSTTSSPRVSVTVPTGTTLTASVTKYLTSSAGPSTEHLTTSGNWTSGCSSGCTTVRTVWEVRGHALASATAGTVAILASPTTEGQTLAIYAGSRCTTF